LNIWAEDAGGNHTMVLSNSIQLCIWRKGKEKQSRISMRSGYLVFEEKLNHLFKSCMVQFLLIQFLRFSPFPVMIKVIFQRHLALPQTNQLSRTQNTADAVFGAAYFTSCRTIYSKH
jgi:hypothetical protein